MAVQVQEVVVVAESLRGSIQHFASDVSFVSFVNLESFRLLGFHTGYRRHFLEVSELLQLELGFLHFPRSADGLPHFCAWLVPTDAPNSPFWVCVESLVMYVL